jgi:hypothetical protein
MAGGSIDEQQVINACMAQLEKSFGEQALSHTIWVGQGNDFIANEAGIAQMVPIAIPIFS